MTLYRRRSVTFTAHQCRYGEIEDTLALEVSGEIRGGSSPSTGTNFIMKVILEVKELKEKGWESPQPPKSAMQIAVETGFKWKSFEELEELRKNYTKQQDIKYINSQKLLHQIISEKRQSNNFHINGWKFSNEQLVIEIEEI